MPSLTRRLLSIACAATLVVSLLSIWTIINPFLLDMAPDASHLLHEIIAPGANDAHRFWASPTSGSGELETTRNSTALEVSPFKERGTETLGVADKIYVLSLPRRADRRRSMERLRQTLGLHWTYLDALDADMDPITNIHAHIRSRRTEIEQEVANGVLDDTFQWPDASLIDTAAYSGLPLGLADSDYWSLRHPLSLLEDDMLEVTRDPSVAKILTPVLGFAHPEVLVYPLDTPSLHDSSPPLEPLTCASKNHVTGPPFDASLPGYMLLTSAKIACWRSHLEIIRKVAEGGESGKSMDDSQAGAVAVVLEDDVDMERDIHARLREVWGLLPSEWDIVFLGDLYCVVLPVPYSHLISVGHCWSNESHYPSLQHGGTGTSDGPRSLVTLHPSFAPKCTHAYALTRTGARRLLLYLRYTPFAYSRALDQAISWLILSGKLRAFSVVPSVVVQRKMAHSDIDAGGRGMGSLWRDRLDNGVLGEG